MGGGCFPRSITRCFLPIEDGAVYYPRFPLLVGQIGPYVQPIGNGTLFRLGIRNLSPVNSIEDVVAEVTNIQPNPPHFLPVPLHVMHDNPVQGAQYEGSFTLGPDQTRYVDVVAISNMQLGSQVQLKHAVHGISEVVTGLGPGSQLTVTVRGHDCSPAFRVVGIVGAGGEVVLM
jgi:hypothetical protein